MTLLRSSAILAVVALAGCGGSDLPGADRTVGSPPQCQERVLSFVDARYLAEGDVAPPPVTDLKFEVRKACQAAPGGESVGSVAHLVRTRLHISQSGF